MDVKLTLSTAITLAVDVFKAQLAIHLSCLQVNQVMLMTKICDSLLIFTVVFLYQQMCWSTIKTHVVLACITVIYEARIKTLLTSTTNFFGWNIKSLEGQVLLIWLMTPNMSWQLNTVFVEIKLAGITTVWWALDCFPTSITQCAIILWDFTKSQDMLMTELAQFSFAIILHLSDCTMHMSYILITYSTMIKWILWFSKFFPTNITIMKIRIIFISNYLSTVNERMLVFFTLDSW